MKMLPVQLSLNPQLGLWGDMLWRCPPAPSSQLAELKTQLPPSLPSDPRLWGREDVTVFLRFCEREFDLPKVDHDLFQMNGKALCLLTRADFGHRCPGAGDVLHNVLQMLIIESHMMQWHLPNSPVTPTSRYPLSPHSHPQTPTWPPIGAPPDSPFHNAHMHHFMAPNSVTLSPPPSVDSQASSPPQSQEQNLAVAAAAAAAAAAASVSGASTSSSSSSSTSSGSSNSGLGVTSSSANGNLLPPAISVTMSSGNGYPAHHATASTGANSNQSDSDEEGSYSELAAANSLSKSSAAAAVVAAHYSASPPTTPILKDMPQSLSQQITNSFVNSWSQNQAAQAMSQKYQPNGSSGGSVSAPTTPSYMQPVKREFFPETTEPNTNGRLLWDFLQQLLNDRNQKYSDLIAWKCRDTGVFKIVDPAGLAKLWGIQKNHLSMNYDKMSRALRYYYRVNILRKVQGERHCYQFLRNPTELKNIKNISLLRQSVAGNGGATTAAGGANNANGASNSNTNNNNINSNNNNNTNNGNSSNQSPSTNLNSTNWTLPHPQSPQRHPAAHGSNGNGNGTTSNSLSHSHNHSNGLSSPHMSLPAISQSAAAAAVAAAAAAAYGPPPTSPLFMHAINGAFQYLSNPTGAPPNSPAMPHTPSEKFQFGALKVEHNSGSRSPDHGDEMKPTDLSVTGNSTEKRPYSSPSAEDCYPLIRNADGLTTIKLIRYNNESHESSAAKQTAHEQQQQHHQQQQQAHTEQQQQAEQQQQHTPMDHMDNEGHDEDSVHAAATAESNKYGAANLMPTDLRK